MNQTESEAVQDATVAFNGPHCLTFEQMFSGDAKLSKVGPDEWLIPKAAAEIDRDIIIDSHFFGLTVLYVPRHNKVHLTE